MRLIPNDTASFSGAINALAAEAHECAEAKGWYEQTRTPLELLCLIHAEISEACEAMRKDNPPDKHCPQHNSATVELADAIIRIIDMSNYYGWNIGEAVLDKMRFNWTREQRHGGKAY